MRIQKQILYDNPDNNPHYLICGDNLNVLKSIHSLYDEKISLIYIDPPYNRGDNFKFYNDAMKHDKWINNIEKVLLELKSFLKRDGSIWISIDDSEMAYLKVCCDRVFGRNNFITTIVWQKRNTRENRNIFSNNHEYVLVYAKNKSHFKKKRKLLPATEELLRRYKNPDNDPRGLWQSITLSVQAGHAVNSQFYSIVSPTGKKHDPPKGRCWIYNETRMKEEINNNNIWFGEDGSSVPRLKKFLSESNVGIVPETLWTSDFAGTTKDAKKELISLDIYDKDIFDTPKPELLLYRIMQIASNSGDIIMDCFAGSGTTCAVAHKCQRNYIGIDVDEKAIKYAIKRMEKVCEGEQGGISKVLEWRGGGDFLSLSWK